MQSKKEYKVGKILKYDGYLGEIVTSDNDYYFTKNDILDNCDLSKDDLVVFDSKSEDTFPQAYYVKKLKIKNTTYLKNKDY